MPEPRSCKILDWDSRFFGRRIARCELRRLTPRTWPKIRKWCAAKRIDCLYFLADPTDLRTRGIVETERFKLADVRLTLSAETRPARRPSAGVRAFREEDLPALKKIATGSHRLSRFYQDGGFSKKKCDALYETWIEKSCRGWADVVLVAEYRNRPAGYLTVHRRSSSLGEIGLVAVAPFAQGQGLGRALVEAGMGWLTERNVKKASVTTQGVNVAAQRLYQSCGFRTEEVSLWYHWWSER